MLVIEQRPAEEMFRDVIQSYPDEGCGFILGKELCEERMITEIHPVTNTKEGDKRKRFEISAKDYLHAERLAEEKGLQLLGVYHSHPDHPPIPSEHDRLSAQPYFSYVILSVFQKSINGLRSWRLNNDMQFEEEKLENQSIHNQKM